MAVVEQYPYVDENGNENYDLVKHSSDNAKPIIQLETGREYEEAIDVYPSKYTYVEIEEIIQHENETSEDESTDLE